VQAWIEKPVKNRRNWSGPVSSVFDKLDSESDFFKKLIFFKWFAGFGTGLPILLTGLPILTNFNHYRSIGLLISVPVYRFLTS
jgi:hypothetical protein